MCSVRYHAVDSATENLETNEYRYYVLHKVDRNSLWLKRLRFEVDDDAEVTFWTFFSHPTLEIPMKNGGFVVGQLTYLSEQSGALFPFECENEMSFLRYGRPDIRHQKRSTAFPKLHESP